MASSNQSNRANVYIDHITILLTPQDFDSPPSWLTENFTLLDGGIHTSIIRALSSSRLTSRAAKKSRIKLISFADGSYIELFSWIGTPPSDHPWGIKSPGLVDFALSVRTPSTSGSNWERLQNRLSEPSGDGHLGVRYAKLEGGGRERPDGQRIEWENSRPDYFEGSKTSSDFAPQGRIEVPFWCHDVTARNLRTPFDDPSKTTHPCGASGVREIEVVVPSWLLAEYSQLYASVTGAPSEWSLGAAAGGKRKYGYLFQVESPVPSDLTEHISVREPYQEADHVWLRERGIGITGLSLHVQGREGHGTHELGSSGTGRITLIW